MHPVPPEVALYVPIAQLVQVLEPAEVLYEPGAHGVQDPAPNPLYFPAGQIKQVTVSV